MQRTISLRIILSPEQDALLTRLQEGLAQACRAASRVAAEQRCCNRVQLHHLCYYSLREQFPELGSQMVCNALRKVAGAYKTLLANRPKLKQEASWPLLAFKPSGSVHFDKRTSSIKGDALSLFTTEGRIHVVCKPGEFQRNYLAQGAPKEAELVRKAGGWFFNLVLDLPDTPALAGDKVMGVDLGENNLAATSTGKLFGGGKLRFERDKYLNLRKRLQRNGSQSAKQLLRKVSGRERRHVRHVNHEVSKAIVAEALRSGCAVIALEKLTHLRKRIRAGRRMRSRLHRWAWAQLQQFVEYKARACGLRVVYVNPAYTSRTCAVCGNEGHRERHRFSCPVCGRLAHADLNAGRNLASLACLFRQATGAVNRPNVAKGSAL